MQGKKRGSIILLFVSIAGLSVGTLRALAEKAPAPATAKGNRGPASVTRDPRVAAGFPDPLAAKIRPVRDTRGGDASRTSRGNWSLANLEGTKEFSSRGNLQPRSPASRGGAQAVPGQASQVFPDR